MATIIENGDLVEVIFPKNDRYHFSVMVGVAFDKEEDYEIQTDEDKFETRIGTGFFINCIDNEGKVVHNTGEGWYHPEDVNVLCEDYFRRGKYKDVDPTLISDAVKRAEYNQAKMNKIKAERSKRPC